MIIRAGKRLTAPNPTLRPTLDEPTMADWDAMSEMTPANHGPREQPRSPKIASNPNISVPPFGMFAAVKLKVPGHIRLTDSPQSAHPNRESIGKGLKTVII